MTSAMALWLRGAMIAPLPALGASASGSTKLTVPSAQPTVEVTTLFVENRTLSRKVFSSQFGR
jgi:hypothetical protein